MSELPVPYPDELWYSIVARRLRDWGYLNRSAELRSVYGSSAPTINMVAPLRPRQFSASSKGQSTPSTRVLAARNTLLPYYLAFASPSRREAMLAVLESPDVLVKLRLSALTRRLVPASLRFCRDCMDTDMMLFGEAYWHRSHQVPGMDHCPEHGLVLFESSVPYQPAKLDYWTAHRSRCRAAPTSKTAALMGRPLSKSITQVVMSVLNSAELISLWIDRRRYAVLLAECGYEAKGCRIAATAFEAAFREFLRQRRADADVFGCAGWWLPAFTGVSGELTPMQHLLLREFVRHRLIRVRRSHVPINVVAAHAQFVT